MLNDEHTQITRLLDQGIAFAHDNQFETALSRFNEALALYHGADTPHDETDLNDVGPYILINCGITLGILDRQDEAIAVYGELVEGLREPNDSRSKALMAQALFNQGVAFSRQGNPDNARLSYHRLLHDFGGEQLPPLVNYVSTALFNLGLLESHHGRPEDAVGLCDRLVGQFGESGEVESQVLVAAAMINKGLILSRLDRFTDALGAYDAVLTRYTQNPVPELAQFASKALYNKGVVLLRKGDREPALSIFEDLIRDIGPDTTSPELVPLLTNAFLNKAAILGEMEQFSAAQEIFETILEHFDQADNLDVQESVAEALINQAFCLESQGEVERADALYTDLLIRFNCSERGKIRQLVSMAEFRQGLLHENEPSPEKESVIEEQVEEAPDLFDITETESLFDGELDGFEDDEEIIELIEAVEEDVTDDVEAVSDEIPAANLSLDPDIPDETVAVKAGEQEVNALMQIIEEIKKEYLAADDPESSIELANALINKGIDFGERAEPEAAVVFFDAVLALLDPVKEASVYPVLIKAYYNKGVALTERNKPFEALDAYEQAIIIFDGTAVPDCVELIADIIINKGFLLYEMEDADEALANFDELVERFGGQANTARIQELIIEALLKKCEIYTDLNQTQAAFDALDAVEHRLQQFNLIDQTKTSAMVIFWKGLIFEKLQRFNASSSLFKDIIKRFGDERGAEIEEIVTNACRKLDSATLRQAGLKDNNRGKLLKLCNEIDQLLISKACSSVQEVSKASSPPPEPDPLPDATGSAVDLGQHLVSNCVTALDDFFGDAPGQTATNETADPLDDLFGEDDDAPADDSVSENASVNDEAPLTSDETSDTDDTVVGDFLFDEDEDIEVAHADQRLTINTTEAAALLEQGNGLRKQHKFEEAIALFDQIVSKLDPLDGPRELIEVQLAEALLLKGMSLERQGQLEGAVAEYCKIVERFPVDDPNGCSMPVLKAYFQRGIALDKLERHDEEFIIKFGDTEKTEVKIMVAKAIYHKAIVLMQKGKIEQALARFIDLIDRYINERAPELETIVAKAMLEKGESHFSQDDLELSVRTFDNVIKRFGSAEVPEILEIVANANFNKGIILDKQGESARAISVFEEITKRYRDTIYPGLQEVVQRAYYYKGLASGW